MCLTCVHATVTGMICIRYAMYVCRWFMTRLCLGGVVYGLLLAGYAMHLLLGVFVMLVVRITPGECDILTSMGVG